MSYERFKHSIDNTYQQQRFAESKRLDESLLNDFNPASWLLMIAGMSA